MYNLLYDKKSFCLLIFFLLIKIIFGQDNRSESNIHFDCFPQCLNGGQCENHRTCKCPSGYGGRSCELDLCHSVVQLSSMKLNLMKSDPHKGILECAGGYKPKRLAAVPMECLDGIWKPTMQEVLKSDFRCEPFCDTPALNGGFCIGPNVHQCPYGFAGKSCEFSLDTNCPELNLTIPYITKQAFSINQEEIERSILQCMDGYQSFEGASNIVEVYCISESWSYLNGTSLNQLQYDSEICRAVCDDPCLNGGACVHPNQCECSPQFEGRRCQTRKCLTPKPEIDHMIYEETSSTPLAKCEEEYQLSNGLNETAMWCSEDGWRFDQFAPNEEVTCIEVTNCPGIPRNITNAQLVDITLGVKEAQCASGFAFPSGETSARIACVKGEWRIAGNNSLKGGCVPKCEFECRNGGYCADVNTCVCPPNTSGRQCEELICSILPFYGDIPFQKSDSHLVLECRNGTSFVTGHSSLNLTCKDGQYVNMDESYFSQLLYECLPNCYKKCLNGGTCKPDGTCHCSSQFYGDFCESELNCVDTLPVVLNSYETRISSHELVLTCNAGFELPGRKHSINVYCTENGWRIDQYTVANPDISCQPVCKDNCSGHGKCTAPGVCLCSKGFGGSFCDKVVELPCTTAPSLIANSIIEYNLTDGLYECLSGHVMQDGGTTKKIKCQNGGWEILECNCNDESLPKCFAQCQPECQNGGICVAPNTCECSEKFTGRRCQTKKPLQCLHTLPPVPNSKIHINNEGSYVSCDKGYAFPHGSNKEAVICKDGAWLFSSYRPRGRISGCYPVCSIPCQNRGKCVAPETCHCIEPYTGPSCETLRSTLCWTKPPTVGFANLVYSPFEAVVNCYPGYAFRSQDVSLKLTCVDGKWSTPSSFKSPLPPCIPVCTPNCMNGGICIKPNACQCLEDYEGLHCEKIKPPYCLSPPTAISSATIRFTNNKGYLTCIEGYRLESGYTEVNIICEKGSWVTATDTGLLVEHLECVPVCEKPCANSGVCVGPNMCQCGPDFAGQWCDLLKCKSEPKLIPNSLTELSEDKMRGVSRCKPGYRLRWGSLGLTFECQEGHWRYLTLEVDLDLLLECLPVCTKPCLNGGRCVAPNQCQCTEGYFGTRCMKRYGTTITGEKCKFPFRYKDNWYFGCTGVDYHRPWCATTTNTQNLITSWGVCVADIGPKKVIVTYEGLACIFPFTYRGQSHRECTTRDKGRPWCGTEVNSYHHIVTWGYCNKDWGSQSVTLTVKGDECELPFNWQNQVHVECLNNGMRPWCPLSDHSKDRKHGYCMADWGYTSVTLTKNGNVCIFPFIHDVKTYDACFSTRPGQALLCAIKIDEQQNGLVYEECFVDKDSIGTSAQIQTRLSSRFPYIGRHISEVVTISDLRCILPFWYKNQEYQECTSRDSRTPWCATKVDDDGAMLERDYCPPNWDIPEVNLFDLASEDKIKDQPQAKAKPEVHTVRGNNCTLPFIHEGETHFGCVESGYKRPWCATKVDNDRNVIQSEPCPDNWGEKMCPFKNIKQQNTHLQNKGPAPVIYTEDGTHCILPFVYLGRTYATCTSQDSMRSWCPTVLDEDGTPLSWGYCADGWDLQETKQKPMFSLTLCEYHQVKYEPGWEVFNSTLLDAGQDSLNVWKLKYPTSFENISAF